jgi:tetratricopeptide (TPR) repeat protein
LNNALQHHRAGRLADAERIYRQILAIDARHSDSLHLLGMIAYQGGNHQEAAETIREAIRINKKEALYHSNLGNVLHAQGKLDEAVACYQRAVILKPDYADALNNLGNALVAQGRIPDAISHYQRVIVLNPGHADAHTNLGVALAEQGRIAEAIPLYERALELKPECAEAFSNLGNALQAQDKLNEAVACYVRALTLKPGYMTAHYNLGNTLQALDRLDDAVACYDRAVLIQPRYAQALYGKALAQLLQGNFAAGWHNFERRWETAGQTPMRAYPQPFWAGEKLTSGRLLLWGEQGVGDEVMFAGLVPEVVRTGIRCILDCDPRLQPFFARSFPGVEVVSRLNPMQSLDLDVSAHLPTGSLPRLFRNTEAAFTATSSPFLAAHPAQRQVLRDRYTTGRRVIGLAWYTKNPKTGPGRSINLSLLAPLFERKDILWVSLQYGEHDAVEQQATSANAPILIDREIDQLVDLDIFAAQIAAMDMVITIDNSTAHLAGALGVPVWVLLPFARDWRWLQARTDSPWYPTMRLFRQPKPGDWLAVVEKVQSEL